MLTIWVRKISLLIIFAISSCSLWSNDFKPKDLYLVEPGVYIEFYDETISLTTDGFEWIIPEFSGKYHIEYEDKFRYIIIDDITQGILKFGLLYVDEKMILFDTLTDEVIFASSTSSKDVGLYNDFAYFFKFQASSFFCEEYRGKSFVYKADNLSTWNSRLPWVEGIDGNGVGEWLKFESELITRSLYIINGYYDPNRPYLYSKNNRIKEFRLTAFTDNLYSDKRFEKIYELSDLIDLHEINLPGDFEFFKIEIISVYSGSVYDDTCLTGLYTDIRLGH